MARQASAGQQPDAVFVTDVPDLIQPEEYQDHPAGRLVRLRITVGEGGVEILGDALRPRAVEEALRWLEEGPWEQMLCG
ncbi:hypothetical protein GCM10009639_24430 [Kitasatospora putterlickiae]|uniref:Uncharacterized protein n=1 Tax=Kitasatospora putterlickiae TaxID=221725 RepID=A0ABN1XXY4_9ACTN